MSMAPDMSGNLAFPPMGHPDGAQQSMSPPMSGGHEYYPPSSGPSPYDDSGYRMPSVPPHQPMTPPQPTSSNHFEAASVAPAFSSIDYGQSPYAPHLYLETQGLPSVRDSAVDGRTGFSHHQEASEWLSSGSDSTYSTSSDDSRHGGIWPTGEATANSDWQDGSFVPTYPLRELHSPSGGPNAIPTSTTPVFFPYSTSPPLDASHVYTSMVDMPLSHFPDDHALLDPHPQRFSSISPPRRRFRRTE
ncbi:hypothetical protein ACRALDRAFT_1074867 [Sodiomyces alcalophilus JCM 7366]|uniref:uncharacterized protein n=1 Tax=Sodiomyces alcalophilus JCM 7366 TaxID=591952 RepID=UPI0039B60023